jgi:hypothetical protein
MCSCHSAVVCACDSTAMCTCNSTAMCACNSIVVACYSGVMTSGMVMSVSACGMSACDVGWVIFVGELGLDLVDDFFDFLHID